MASRIDALVQVRAPLSMTYRRGTSFESFPDFVPGLDAVHALEDGAVRFVADVAGTKHDWEVRIAERVPNRRLVIQSEDRVRMTGVFEFSSQRRGVAVVRAEVSYDIDPLRGRLLDLLVDPKRQLEDGLRRFADAVEAEHAARNGATPGAVPPEGRESRHRPG